MNKSKIKWKSQKGFPNLILQRTNFYISYNPCIRDCIFDKILTTVTTIKPRIGKSETALVIPAKEKSIIPQEFFILNGDFRKEYEACGDNQKKCMKVYTNNKKKYDSDFSTNKPIEIKN